MKEPEHNKERRKTMEDALARLPQYHAVYNMAPATLPTLTHCRYWAAFSPADAAPRFYQHLVHDKQLALNVFAGAQNRRGPGLFNVVGIPRPGVKIEDLEKAIDDEIEAVKKDGVTQQELDKVRTQLLRQAIQTRGSVLFLANQMGTLTSLLQRS